jgi:hypothetical protein
MTFQTMNVVGHRLDHGHATLGPAMFITMTGMSHHDDQH